VNTKGNEGYDQEEEGEEEERGNVYERSIHLHGLFAVLVLKLTLNVAILLLL
jgi:hypothetical protein